MGVKSYEELEVWREAMDLVVLVYNLTQAFPREEVYGLTSQIRRAAVSVPSNIAEGHGRSSTKEFLHHLSISRGSLLEVDTQALIARRPDFWREEQHHQIKVQARIVGRLLNGLIRALQRRN